MKVYLLGWPGSLGGATTKFTHLISLLEPHYEVTVVSVHGHWDGHDPWLPWLRGKKVSLKTLEQLPRRLEGWGVVLCDDDFLKSARLGELRRRGLRIAWGNEMMWPLPSEPAAILSGHIDAMLFVSEAQYQALAPEYQRMLGASLDLPSAPPMRGRSSGWLRSAGRSLRWHNVGNFIDPDFFPAGDPSARGNGPLIVGRLSRPDPLKFPPDFPDSYESLGLTNARFRVMGWGEPLRKIWPDERFDGRWELLEPQADPGPFLRGLDLFVYEVGPGFKESWGRCVVEAMLSGAVPLVQRGGGHHLEEQVRHGRTGFVCADRAEFSTHARFLEKHPETLRRMSRAARAAALASHANREVHLRKWRRVFAAD